MQNKRQFFKSIGIGAVSLLSLPFLKLKTKLRPKTLLNIAARNIHHYDDWMYFDVEKDTELKVNDMLVVTASKSDRDLFYLNRQYKIISIKEV